MRLVHEHDGVTRTLATRVEVAESRVAQARGLMFRRSVPDQYALVFPFDGVGSRSLHMVFVPFSIDAVWLDGAEVTKVERLRAWTGLGWGRADCVVELPAGAAADVAVGDRIRIVEDRVDGDN
ncbi:DUF192 domain-containing protein [Salinigranum halophilum]|uniref:DUF192 domain-containing protein n=1 Tax=Salinigranum halophilum TaxID=2565931 RepID=UPI0010A7DCB5|nr:DUF192 domain-containing protein [Salinigranum halophilum]